MNKPFFEEVLPQLFRAEIPLPRNPLKATNSYLIKSRERNLIIDTGMNREECMTAFSAVLRELQIDLAQTDFFITHLHADHLGLVSELAKPSSRIFFNRLDAAVVTYGDLWKLLFNAAKKHGFHEEELKEALFKHPGYRYSHSGPINFEYLHEGDRLTYGPYTFTCVHTPGHTPGHLCLYEQSQKLFLSGDHILGDITPNISAWEDSENPLQQYLQSLDKVSRMEIELLLPGHRRVVSDCRGRIEELKKHHHERLEEVSSIIRAKGPSNAYEIASHMEWDIEASDWEHFPITQKWFAIGEAIAHLHYLEEVGKIRRKEQNGTVLFYP
ncbi:MAG: MBL fold metallo-hydrolase [Dethiobacteria bacterium]|jgi:glyoxylase-like metal-dependent hydrolase (beta-lactamase superfamily II)|nr:MBL fold metallo-hydrolase [Bacillota bacterium]HOB29513.1 MBL fold metallo-hydrolase [Bacillota bacterium]HPZ42195.1 MBL fold metallo-hydrolase [Bacillota bacterium]HQD53062.1 MBL fold metallo-hydrolase [Bacillota bacterium]